MGIRRFICICIVFVFFVGYVFSQNSNRIHEQYRYHFLTVDEGLSNNRVRGLVQDNYGFIWVGTRTGLGLFDGYTIKAYDYYYVDTNEYVFTETRGSLCDSRGTVWFVGEYGICYYNRQEDRFEKLIDPAYPDRINLTLGIDEDHDSLIWFTNNQEILSYNPEKQGFKHFISNPEIPGSLPVGYPERLLVVDIIIYGLVIRMQE